LVSVSNGQRTTPLPWGEIGPLQRERPVVEVDHVLQPEPRTGTPRSGARWRSVSWVCSRWVTPYLRSTYITDVEPCPTIKRIPTTSAPVPQPAPITTPQRSRNV